MFTAVTKGEATEVGRIAGCVFLAVVSLAAAVGFLVYGGRLFLMLRRFPVESRGRTKKLREARRCLTQCVPALSMHPVCRRQSSSSRHPFACPCKCHTIRLAIAVRSNGSWQIASDVGRHPITTGTIYA